MNKKGQAILAGFGIFVIVLITSIVFIDPVKDVVDIARDDTHLNCTATDKTTGQAATCVLVDWVLFYVLISAFSGGAAYLFVKRKTQ